MNVTYFLHKNNTSILWDVISDEDVIQTQPPDFKSILFNIFSSNIQNFYKSETNENNTITLVDLNKKYILLILKYAKKTIDEQKLNKIKIHEELSPISQKELITFEEIQNDKRSQFEKDLAKLKDNFSNSFAVPIPETPNFSDNIKDTPISEMGKKIKEMTEQRNYEVEQINKNYIKIQNNDKNENWLTPQETSLKNGNQQKTHIQKPLDNNKIKHIKIENDSKINNGLITNVLELLNDNNSPKKNVSWGENSTITKTDDNEYANYNNIFNKLKKINNDNLIEEPKQKTQINIEEEIRIINSKIDKIFEILQTK
jgi:hypothetical protein